MMLPFPTREMECAPAVTNLHTTNSHTVGLPTSLCSPEIDIWKGQRQSRQSRYRTSFAYLWQLLESSPDILNPDQNGCSPAADHVSALTSYRCCRGPLGKELLHVSSFLQPALYRIVTLWLWQGQQNWKHTHMTHDFKFLFKKNPNSSYSCILQSLINAWRDIWKVT